MVIPYINSHIIIVRVYDKLIYVPSIRRRSQEASGVDDDDEYMEVTIKFICKGEWVQSGGELVNYA